MRALISNRHINHSGLNNLATLDIGSKDPMCVEGEVSFASFSPTSRRRFRLVFNSDF